MADLQGFCYQGWITRRSQEYYFYPLVLQVRISHRYSSARSTAHNPCPEAGGLLLGDLQTHLDVGLGQGGSRWTQRSLPSSTRLGFWDSSLALLPFLQCVRVTGFPGGNWPGASRSSLPVLFSHFTWNKLKPQISYWRCWVIPFLNEGKLIKVNELRKC